MSNSNTPNAEDTYGGEERRRQFDTEEARLSTDVDAYYEAAQTHHEQNPALPPLTPEQFFQRKEDDLAKVNGEIGTRAKVAATMKQRETAETDTGKIEAELTQLSARYIGVDAMNEALAKLEGVNVQIPDDEIVRLKGLLPAKLTNAHKEAITKLREACEGNAAPLMMQLPEKIVVDGEEKPFTIATMYEVIQKAKEAGSLPKPLWLSDYVTQATKDQKWDSRLGVWTSTCLIGSKDKRYSGEGGQLEHQKQVIGDGREIHADMVLAMALRYIQTAGTDEVMKYNRDGFMRLNDTGSGGYPLRVDVSGDGLDLGRSDGHAYSPSGVGGSLRISS